MRAKLSSPNTFRSEGLFATNLGENWLNCVCFLAEYIFCFMFSGMKHIACQRDPFGYCLGSQCCPIYHHGELSRSPLPANVSGTPFPSHKGKKLENPQKKTHFFRIQEESSFVVFLRRVLALRKEGLVQSAFLS